MRILFTTLRNTSHFLPLIPFLDACRQRGHEVAVAAPPDLAERVAKTGATFFPFGHPGDEGLRPLWMRMAGASEAEARRLAVGDIFADACAGAALPKLLETMSTWQPSIVVRESQEYAALLACEKLGVPHARVSITLRSAEASIFPEATPALDAHRRTLGLAADPAAEQLRNEPSLSQFPATLDPDEATGARVKRFRVAGKPASALPSWWAQDKQPLLYLTFGTVAGGMDAMRSAYGVALAAVRELPIRVLLTVGSELPLESLGELPRNVHAERFVPQDDVFAHAKAVMCHGGSGTVLGTLAAGLPMVVAPLFADQPDNAARVQAVGAGLALPTRCTSADEVRRALTRVLEEPSFRVAAVKVAAEIAALPLVADAALELERLAAR